MPERAPTMCRAPGCAAIITSGRYCERHVQHQAERGRVYDATTRENDPALAMAKRIRSSARWTRVAASAKRRWPVCSDPFKDGCQRPTAVINHIVPLRIEPSLAFHDSNHAPLCTHCDALIGRMERSGQDTRAMFGDWRLRYPLASVRASAGETSTTCATVNVKVVNVNEL
jgi:5-methylcytosine-specific restriction endonuclease McrA